MVRPSKELAGEAAMSKKLFFSFGLAPLPLLAAAAFLVATAGGQAAPAPPTVSVTVTIDSVTNISAGDPFGGSPDFFSTIKIDGGTPFTTTTIPNSGTLTAPAGWTFTKNVRRVGPKFQIRLELWEGLNSPLGSDGVDVDPSICAGSFPFGCAILNVNRPDADTVGLDLNMDREPPGALTAFDSTGDAAGAGTCSDGDNDPSNGNDNLALPCTVSACATGTQGEAATICFTVTVGPATAGTLVVTKTADTNDGNCSVLDCSLREAVDNARDGDTISLPNLGFPYRLTFRQWVDGASPLPDFDEPGHLRITRKNLTILGPATGAGVVIEQTSQARVFDVHTGASVTMENLTIRGGVAAKGTSSAVSSHDHGGGIHNHGTVHLVNVTLTDNHAPLDSTQTGTGGGGAIYNAGGLTLDHVTIAGNDAAQLGGGIAGAPGTFRNALVANNTGPGGNCTSSATPTDNGGNNQFPGATCGFAGAPLASSPIGALASDYTFWLIPGSKAIDGGTNTGCAATDQAGVPRPLDGNGDGVAVCDSGATEYDPEGLGVIHQPLNSATGQPGPVTLTFDDVTTAGTSTLTISSTGPARPAGFRAGTPTLYYDIGTNAVFTGGVTVCIDYTGTAFTNEAGLRLFHRTGSSWQDTTQSLDTAANRICGRTTSFSVFAIFGANQSPVAFITEPPGGYRLNEGSSVVLQGSGSDPDGDPLTYEWSPATELNDRTLAAPTFSPRDDGTRTYTLVVRDGETTSAPVSTNVRVDNVAPSLRLTAPAGGTLYRAGSSVSIRGTFTDPGVLDTHTCTVDWDDGTPAAAGAVTESNGAGTCTASRTFAAAGVYTLVMTVDDGDGGTASASTMVVVYDPRAGWVLGAGQITSAAGAYRPNPALTGSVVFNFVAQYFGFGPTPTGVVVVVLPGGVRFASTSLEWLVVTGFKSQVRGTGSVNGLGSYGFLVTAYDGQQPGGGGVDRFRFKLWNRATGAVVYDNVLDPTATDDVDRAKPQATGFGSAIAIFRL
jgi:CSLREA domain-containing protein